MTRPTRTASITAADRNTSSDQPSEKGDTASVKSDAATADSVVSAQVAQLRERIDDIDGTLIALLRERASLSRRVEAARSATGHGSLIVTREHEVLGRFHCELGAIGTELGLLVLRAGRDTASSAEHRPRTA